MQQQLIKLTEDLTPSQFQELLIWLWRMGVKPTVKLVERWRELSKIDERWLKE